MPEAPLLEVENLTVTFRTEAGPVRAVDRVSFTIGAREIVSIVGESGSGKTVTVMSVLGLLGEVNVAIAGSIRFRGRELVGLPPRALRELRGGAIAMIFQDPMTALTPVYTIGWQIVEQLQAHQQLSARAAKDRAVELVRAVGIADPKAVVDRYPHQLSGGMRQRAVIAMALSCNPALLLADEPTTALDVTVQAQILELLLRLREEFGSSIVLITHDMGVVAEVADRVMVMYGGRIVERGTRDMVLDEPRHPYTAALLESIPPMHGAKPPRLPAIPGSPPSLLRLPPGCAFAPRCRARMPDCDRRPKLIEEGGHAVACFLRHPAAAEART